MAYLSEQAAQEQIAAKSHAASASAAASFRLAMREFASGIAIIATGRGDNRNGCTATSICSLSLEPPSLIVCLSRASTTLSTLRDEAAFGVSFLGGDKADLADRFAGRDGLRGAARFAGEEWTTLMTGAPLLQGAVAIIDCEVEEIIERHTHAIIIGRVVSAHAPSGRPLLHWRGKSAPFR
jgi:flavin reductase (DIM6/NTAB) family NADH-FMN oxidoreductase RutF